jgi:hypothetical protein
MAADQLVLLEDHGCPPPMLAHHLWMKQFSQIFRKDDPGGRSMEQIEAAYQGGFPGS